MSKRKRSSVNPQSQAHVHANSNENQSDHNQAQNPLVEELPIYVQMDKLELQSLKKYKKTFRLRTRHNNAPRPELLNAAIKHFRSWEPNNEDDIIEAFVTNIKNLE
eukprot:TRINITY_DN12180_c0_g1_i1.p1 TRINITY_DN12180_c0_g1~~TRINITY_DN12180_c0_g1_i1.p1  ORF type:complete len:106 (+),score=5.54 TRINITY_DN12180_c0_g1_i1:42-359(+)